MKILIVDDHGMMRRMIRRMLGNPPNVFEASNGVDGLKTVKENPDIGLILADYNMPQMNGLEMITAIRRDIATFNGHVVFISSVRDKDVEAKAKRLGAAHWLNKPFSTEDLAMLMMKLA